jgi:hypothetical protein
MTPDERAAIDATDLRDFVAVEDRQFRELAELWESIIQKQADEMLAILLDKRGRG